MSRRALAAAGVVLGLIATGCGGTDDEAAEPATAQDQKIAKLQAQIDRLEKQNAAADDSGKAPTGGASSGPDAEAMLAGLPGAAGLAVGAPGAAGPVLVVGGFTTGDAWSTIKVPIAERVLADAGGPGGLTASQSDQIDRAITLSDNDAAAALFNGLETEHGGLEGASDAVEEMLRRAGDEDTVVSTVGRDAFSTYGQTDWSIEDQFTYMAALAGGCVGNPPSRSYLLDEMSSVGGSDGFGLGAAGVPARWKGGWGPGVDGGYLVRQMGVMQVGGKEMVLTMAALPEDGTFESGQSMLSRIAAWSAANLADRIPAASAC